MTKSQLITLLAQQRNLSRKDAESAVDAVFNSIAASLSPLQKVLLKVRRVISSSNYLKNIAFTENCRCNPLAGMISCDPFSVFHIKWIPTNVSTDGQAGIPARITLFHA